MSEWLAGLDCFVGMISRVKPAVLEMYIQSGQDRKSWELIQLSETAIDFRMAVLTLLNRLGWLGPDGWTGYSVITSWLTLSWKLYTITVIDSIIKFVLMDVS